MATLKDKLFISINSSLLFFVFNLPFISEIATSILGFNFIKDGCRTKLGFLLSVSLFYIATYLTMTHSNKDVLVKLKHTTYASLLFFFVSNATTLHIFNLFFKSFIDCPKNGTLILHSLIYCILLVGIMYFPDN